MNQVERFQFTSVKIYHLPGVCIVLAILTATLLKPKWIVLERLLAYFLQDMKILF